MSLNTGSPIGGSVWEGLGVLLEKVCHWGSSERAEPDEGCSAVRGEVGACAAGVREPEPGRRGLEKLRRGAPVIRNGNSTVSFRLCHLHSNDNRINPGLKKLL